MKIKKQPTRNASPVVSLALVRIIMVINEPPVRAAVEALLGHPDSDAGVNASYGAQLVEYFIHALQPDALTACTITLDHLLYAQRTIMGRKNRLRHGLIDTATM